MKTKPNLTMTAYSRRSVLKNMALSAGLTGVSFVAPGILRSARARGADQSGPDLAADRCVDGLRKGS